MYVLKTERGLYVRDVRASSKRWGYVTYTDNINAAHVELTLKRAKYLRTFSNNIIKNDKPCLKYDVFNDSEYVPGEPVKIVLVELKEVGEV